MKLPKSDLIHRTRYLMGYAAGTENERGDRFEIEEWDPGDRVRHTKVFPSPEAAEKAVRGKGSRAYVRAYSYETANPKNAKGMPLLSTVEKTFYYL